MSKTFWRRGIAASEMAVLAPFLVLLLFGAHDVAQVMSTTIRLERAARVGAQLAIVNPQDLSAVRSAVIAAAPGLTEANVPMPVQSCECASAAVLCTASCASGLTQIVTVSASKPLTALLLSDRQSGVGNAVVRIR
jgi:Flp pilus assembly protein TadG